MHRCPRHSQHQRTLMSELVVFAAILHYKAKLNRQGNVHVAVGSYIWFSFIWSGSEGTPWIKHWSANPIWCAYGFLCTRITSRMLVKDTDQVDIAEQICKIRNHSVKEQLSINGELETKSKMNSSERCTRANHVFFVIVTCCTSTAKH